MRPELGTRGQPWIWLLDVQWPLGQVQRLSSQPCEIVDDKGVTRLYRGGLPQLNWKSDVPILAVSTAIRSVPLTLDLGSRVAEWEAAGHPLEGATATLYRWRQGMTWGQRQVWLTGRLTAVQLGQVGERVRCTLAEDEYIDRAVLWWAPKITLDAFPDADTSAIGQPMPWVIGKGGDYIGVDGQQTVPMSKTECIEQDGSYLVKLLVNGVRSPPGSVTIINTDDGTSEMFPLAWGSVTIEGRKVLYTYVDISGAGTLSVPSVGSNPLYAAWNDVAAQRLNVLDQANDGGGSIIVHLLRHSTMVFDRDQMLTEAGAINRYRFGTYVDKPVAPWDIIREQLLPLLPVSIVPGPRGLRMIVWRHGADRREAIHHLEDGRNCSLSSYRESADIERCTACEVEYAPNDATGALSDTVRTYPQGRRATEGRRNATAYSKAAGLAAVARGEPEEQVIRVQAEAVYHTGTATWITMDRVQYGWAPSSIVTYDVDEDGARLEEGDLVTCTTASLSWSQRVGQVMGMELAGALVRVTVIVYPAYPSFGAR